MSNKEPWWNDQDRLTCPCVYGHFDCARTVGGACSAEAHSNANPAPLDVDREHRFEVTPSIAEVSELVQWTYEGREKGSHYAGMSYEDGIMAVLDWLEGNGPRPDKDED
jgi:hypothetical protein